MILQDGTPEFETVTDLLAEILVAEFQLRRGLREATGVSPGGYAHTLRAGATSS